MIAAVLLLLLAGCDSGSEAPADPFATPRSGGVLRLALSADPVALDPFTASNYAVAYGNLLSAIYDPLVWVDPSTGGVQAHLAESFTSDAAARVWTLSLRPGVLFSDGAALDAAAVKANWQMHADPASHSAYAPAVAGLKLTVLDPLHLAVELPAPNAHFNRTVANGLSYVASPRALGDLKALAVKPIGAGPFVLAEHGAGRIVLRKNATYWQPGRPYLDEVDAQVVPEGKTVPGVIVDHQADLGTVTSPLTAKEAADRHLGLVDLHLSGGLMLLFNTRRPPFDTPAARHAIADSLSAAEMDRRFAGGLGSAARGIFSDTSPLANNQLGAKDDDPQAAAAAFDVLTAGGKKPFDFTFLTVGGSSSAPPPEAVYIQQQVQRFPNVHMKIEVVDTATLIQRNVSGDFDLVLSGLWMSDPEPVLFDFLRPGSPTNVSGYANQEVTDAMNDARLLVQMDARREQYTRVQVQLNKDLPFWVYQQAANAVVFDPRLTGIQPFADGVLLFDRIGLRR